MEFQHFDSNKLRCLAEDFLRDVAEVEEIPSEQHAHLVTSLVRQWKTNDGNAALIAGETLCYLALAKTPLGNYIVMMYPGDPGWLDSLEREWHINRDDIPDIVERLNLGQTTEIVNDDGIVLRLSIDSKERKERVERLDGTVVEEAPPSREEEDYLCLAARFLAKHMLVQVDAEEMDALAKSVVSQWKEYQGHACIFMSTERLLHLKLTNNQAQPVDCKVGAAYLRSCFSQLGIRPEAFDELVMNINCGCKVRIPDQHGVAQILWHDPRYLQLKICPEHLKK